MRIDVLGFKVKHDIPLGGAAWLTLVAPDDLGGVELLPEPTGHPAAAVFQQALGSDARSRRNALRERHSAHRNTPQYFGLDPDEIGTRFPRYRNAFGI